MKKFTISLLILLFLLFNINITPSMAAAKVFKEGFYKAVDLNLPLDVTHTIQNNSFNERSLLIILDTNQIIQQVIRLKPQSEKYTLAPIQSGYTLIIAGDGEVSIN